MEAYEADYKRRTGALRSAVLAQHQALEDASIVDRALIKARFMEQSLSVCVPVPVPACL